MCNENSMGNVDKHEAAEVHPPAASASEIINRESTMSKMWPFVGGVLVGAAGVVTAALVADRLAYGEGGGADLREKTEMLTLLGGRAEKALLDRCLPSDFMF